MSRCNHWTNPPNAIRCDAEAEVLLLAPGHTRLQAYSIIGPSCRACAEACVEEIRAKLGEEWRIEPLEEQPALQHLVDAAYRKADTRRHWMRENGELNWPDGSRSPKPAASQALEAEPGLCLAETGEGSVPPPTPSRERLLDILAAVNLDRPFLTPETAGEVVDALRLAGRL